MLPQTQLELLRFYTEKLGWLLFPWATKPRVPLVERGVYSASWDFDRIKAWASRWPDAAWAVRTGPVPQGSGICVVDVDVKKADGFATLARLVGAMPEVPQSRTPSGGGHFYFAISAPGVRGTVGERGRGVGPGIDIKCNSGSAHLPCGPGSLYRWHEKFNPWTVPLLRALPPALLPRELPEVEETAPPRPAEPIGDVDRYVAAAIAKACDNIRRAGEGEQNSTLNYEAWSLGRLAAARNLAGGPIVRALVEAGMEMPAYRKGSPWLRRDVENKVKGGFEAGLTRPRPGVESRPVARAARRGR